jgi:acyl carrier protein
MSAHTLDELQEVFREVFSNPSLVIGMHTTATAVRGWDSLNHMHLIAEVETRFGVRFSFDEVRQLQNVGDLVTLIDKKRTC